MKSSTPELRAALAANTLIPADAFLFTLVDGTELRYTTADRDIRIDGDLYSSGGMTGAVFDRFGNNSTGCTWKRGLEVDNLSFMVLPRTATVKGLPFLAAVRRGLFDGAELILSQLRKGKAA